MIFYILTKLELKIAKERWMYYVGKVLYRGEDTNIIASHEKDRQMQHGHIDGSPLTVNFVSWLSHLSSAHIIIV